MYLSLTLIFKLKVPETEDDESTKEPELKEFTKLLLNGQRVADDTGKTYKFMWRGYRACVSCNLPKLTANEIRRRFNLAMKNIAEDGQFKKPATPSEIDEPSQIPETQFVMEGK